MTSPVQPPSPRLSAILITKNEAAHISECLATLSFADEVIVVDSGSTDDTVALARRSGATVIQTPDWPGFGPQKNRALAAATGTWIFSIDADERVPPALASEIVHTIANTEMSAAAGLSAYEIPRSSNYCGRFIEHAGWRPDYVLRLFRHGHAQFSDDLVHERVVTEDSVGKLNTSLLHYSFRDFSQVLAKIDNYSTLSARQAYARGKRASVFTALLHGWWAFMRTYFFRLGLLDGQHGLALAISNAEGSYYRYVKIWHLGQLEKQAGKNAVATESRGAKQRQGMKPTMLISVIVTTYNRPDALAAVLRGLLAQTDPAFEIIVADDGSTAATRDTVTSLQRLAGQQPGNPRRLVHAWHADTGFRLSAVRNLGAHAAQGDYIIFLDGDCVPQKDFVSRHRQLAEIGYMVSGSRVLLSEQLTARFLTQGDVDLHQRGLSFWLRQRLTGNINKFLPLLSFGDTPMRHYRKVKWQRIKGCNLGMWRSDYARVNGCDETFVGWGHEDADLVLRLARAGVRRKGGAFATEVFHLWHRENARTTESENRRRVEERMQTGLIEAPQGLRDHPQPDEIIC